MPRNPSIVRVRWGPFDADRSADPEWMTEDAEAHASDGVESRLRASQLYNRSVIEFAPTGLLVVDPELVIRDLNEEMLRILGGTREDRLGLPLQRFLTVPEEVRVAMRESISGAQMAGVAVRLRTTDGSSVVELRGAAFEGPDGRPRGVFAASAE